MTFVSGNRGIQPSITPSASARQQLGLRHGGKAVGQNAQPVRFGGNPVNNAMNNGLQGFVNLTLPTFQKVAEVFIWAFLMQDVFAMWLPRIFALLTEGRKKYELRNDPKMKDKPLGRQLYHYVKENLKGLNWDNFYEGTKREFATGPGLLIVPAAVFLAISRFVNPSVRLPFSAAKGMGKGLRKQFKDAPANPDVKAEVKAYVEHMFQDPMFKKDPSKLKFDKSENLKGWVNKWVDNYFCEDKETKKGEAKKLSEELQKTIREFNREHRMEAYKASGHGKDVNRLIKDEHPLHHTESTWISYQPKTLLEKLGLKETKTGEPMTEAMQLAKAGKRLRQMPVTELIRDLTNMEGLVKGIQEKAANSSNLADSAEQVMQRVIKMKFGISLGATALTAAYLTKLAFWAQNHNTYQATRLLNEKTAQNQGSHASEAGNARSNRAGQQPVITPIAGSASALQPAFSMAAAPMPDKLSPQPFGLPVQAPVVSPFPFLTRQSNRGMDEGRNA
jgi:hypothetical protein